MPNIEPSPWPDEIQDYFSEYSAIAWVPRFLHDEIIRHTEYIADFYPEFRYQDIMIWHDGQVQVRLVGEENHAGLFMETVVDCMNADLTDIYRKYTRV